MSEHSAGDKNGFRLDILDLPTDLYKTKSITAWLHRTNGEIVEPDEDGKKMLKNPVSVNGGAPKATTYFRWNPNEPEECWIEVSIGTERYWLEIPYGFDRDPNKPFPPPIADVSPKIPAAMKTLTVHDHVLRWENVQYDFGGIQDNWRRLPTRASSSKEQQTVDVDRLSLADALEKGASAYLCTEVKREPVYSETVQGRLFAEDGRMTLEVHKTLFGKPRKTMTLPYSGHLSGPQWDIWSSALFEWFPYDQPLPTGRKYLLVVVVQNGVDRRNFLVPDMGEAARMVRAIHGEDSEELREWTTIFDLYKLMGTPKFEPALIQALDDQRSIVREYVIEGILQYIGKTAPDEAVKIVQSRVQRYQKGVGNKEADEFIRQLGNLDRDAEQWKLSFRCLAELLQSKSEEIKRKSLSLLSHDASEWRDSTMYTPDIMNAQEKMALKRALADTKADEGSMDAITTIRKWLDRTH